jgi:glycine cleavage system H protein
MPTHCYPLKLLKKFPIFEPVKTLQQNIYSVKHIEMNVPADLLYTKDHEWLRIEGEFGFIGITDFAQGELGDIVFLEIETLGETLKKEEVFGTIEAVKTVSELFMPVGGEVVEVNPVLGDSPDVVNKDPYGKGWLIKIKMSDPAETGTLLSAEKYQEIL